jgi:transposase
MDVAFEVVQTNQSVAEVAKKYGIHPSTVYRWKKDILEPFINALNEGFMVKIQRPNKKN